MSIHSLPPELLLEIFSLAIPESPSAMPSIYLTRQRILRAFALVHSDWTSVAQEMLRREVWIKIPENKARKVAGQKVHKLCQYPRKQFRTSFLRIDGDYTIVWDLVDEAGFQNVSTLRHGYEIKPNSHQISFYAKFRSLESLQLDSGRFLTQPCQPGSTFCNLRRLTLGNIKLSSYLNVDEIVFAPTSFPRLEHLAIFDLDSKLSALWPQLSTLALYGSHDRCKSFLRQRGQFSRLKHLSLKTCNESIPQLFQQSDTMQLESVHMSVQYSAHSRSIGAALAGIAKEQREGKRNGRIVLYGSKHALQSCVGAEVDLDVFVLRERLPLPPFGDFDGL